MSFEYSLIAGGAFALFYFWKAAKEDLETGFISTEDIKHLFILGLVGWAVWLQTFAFSEKLSDLAFMVEPLRSVVISAVLFGFFWIWMKDYIGKGDILLLLAGQVAFPVFVFGVPFAVASMLIGFALRGLNYAKFRAVPYIFAGSLIVFSLWAFV